MGYSTISYGSSGNDVKKLQEELNKNGYKLDVDGQFGSKTQAAVNDYQKKNGLSVDGIVGKNTWGKLTGSANTMQTPVSKSTSKKTTPAKPTATPRPTYTQSSAVTAAQEAHKKWESNKPSGFESKYSGQINDFLDRILNGEEFEYDVNNDTLWDVYKDNAVKQGKLAMNDTIADAAALTGGYGSSYGVAAGQQAYQQYLSDLNQIVPELHDRAFQRYQSEREGDIQALSILQGLDESDYGRYRDEVADYNTEKAYLYQKLADLSDDDYQKFMTLLDNYENDRSFNEGVRQFEEQMDYQKERDKVSDEQFEKQFALQKAAAARSGSSGGGSGGSKTSTYKAPTEEMYDAALEAYLSGGEYELNKYVSKFPAYNIEALLDYAYRYGTTSEKSKNAGKTLGEVVKDTNEGLIGMLSDIASGKKKR